MELYNLTVFPPTTGSASPLHGKRQDRSYAVPSSNLPSVELKVCPKPGLF